MDQSAGCFDSDMASGDYDHLAKVAAKNSSAITLDRPLRMDYTEDPDCLAGSTTFVRKITMIENVGLENCHVEHATPACPASSYRPGVAYERVTNGWGTGNHHENWCTNSVRFRGSARTLVAHSYFLNSGGATIDIQTGSNDASIIDNTFERSANNGYCQNGAEGTVFSHNYAVPGYRDRSHSFLMHGRYCRESLVESNHLDASPSPDDYWGRQGPRNTLLPSVNYFSPLTSTISPHRVLDPGCPSARASSHSISFWS